MQEFPTTPPIDDAPEDLLAGHLWLTEHVRGAPLRFRVEDSGLLCFGDERREYSDPEEVPVPYRLAVRHVRESLDRDVLRAAVDDVADVAFFGVATVHHGIDYDWDRLAPFLGVDVWSRDAGFRPPDAAAGIVERLGLEPVNAVARELPARDFDPGSYDVPDSAWYDGPAAGVLVRNKRGGRALLSNPAVERREPEGNEASDATAEELATEYATADRLEQIAAELGERGRAVTADALAERAVEAAAREAAPAFEHGSVEASAVRSECGALARQFLADRPDDAW